MLKVTQVITNYTIHQKLHSTTLNANAEPQKFQLYHNLTTLPHPHQDQSHHSHTVLIPTVFAIEVDLQFSLLGAQQRLCHLRNGQPLGVRSVQEVTGAGFLHDLGARVTTHVAESIVAEDDGAVLHPGVGDNKLSTCGERKEAMLTNCEKCIKDSGGESADCYSVQFH